MIGATKEDEGSFEPMTRILLMWLSMTPVDKLKTRIIEAVLGM